MKTLSVLKKDLEFNKNLSSLIDVLKTIAVTQYKILEHKMRPYEKLTSSIESFFEIIDTSYANHIFLSPQNKNQIVIAVTSDSGLLGGLNMRVVTQAIAELSKIPGKLIVVGECGKLYLRDSSIPFVSFGGVNDEARHSQAMQLRDYCVERASKENIGYLKVVYPRPISFTVQRVEVVSFLPFSPPVSPQKSESGFLPEVLLESRLEDVVEYLVYIWMGQKLYEIFGLSRLAEFAARFVHLEESHQKLEDLDTKTRLEYFRVRHELIDRNMREIFATRLLYASQAG
jgi:ATP synthase F1 gamma subunit